MIRSLAVENFRCYKHVEISDLSRLNVIVGKNATGKTALLESVRLALGGTPAVLWSMNQARSVQLFLQQPFTREQWEAIWAPYFFNFETTQNIITRCSNTEGREAEVKIYYDSQKTVTSVPQQAQT